MPAAAPRTPVSSPPARAPLGDGDVDVWLCAPSVLTEDLRAAYRDLLSGSERNRLQRFRVSHAADEFLLGRALLRTTLSRYAPVAPQAWAFELGPHGKPFLAGPAVGAPLAFNLSHTTGLVACAIAMDGQIGVDVEHCGRDLDLRGFSAANFAMDEQAAVAAATTDADLRRTFFQIWTLKEAYIKGVGGGLSLPLDSFWFDLTEPPRLHLRQGGIGEEWRFFHLEPTPDHRLSVALAPQRPATLHARVSWAIPNPDGLRTASHDTAAWTS